MTEEKGQKKKKKANKVKVVGEIHNVTEKKSLKKMPAKKLPQMTFDAWWMRSHKKHGFGPEMKEVVYKHFKATGFLNNKKFDEGLINFGIKS